MDIEVDKNDLRVTRVTQSPATELRPGEARLSIERFGLSANNITYAAMGESMRYWDFFPVTDENDHSAWGRVPVWGFAHVSESTSDLDIDRRVFGYFPLGTELVVRPGRLDDSGFSDVVEHRADLASVYNRYAFVDADPLYRVDDEERLMLLRPLFITSFVVNDFLIYHDLFGADTVLISSASSKTAIGAAFLLAERGDVTVVGLTSPPNVDFVTSLGCYDRVITYDQVNSEPRAHAVYVDVAGRRDVTFAVHQHFAEQLAYSMIVGDTHWDNDSTGEGKIVGPKPTLLFAPVQISLRRREWGREGFESAVADAWWKFNVFVQSWMTLREVNGREDVIACYLELLDGRVDPRIGEICRLVEN